MAAVGALVASAGALMAGEAPLVEGGFAAQVAAHFDGWDLDRDGALSFVETSRLVPFATIRDEAAAALAAIHRVQRGRTWPRAAFNRDDLIADGPGRRPPFEPDYRWGLAQIRDAGRTLFAEGAPSVRGLRQGPLGDCYFVATVAAMVDRNPDDVRRIIREGPDGSFVVRFPDGETVHVRHVSDAEVALGSSAVGQGLWMTVLEKAYGQLVERSLARRGIIEDAIDALGHGGHPTTALELFTGHDAAVLRFGTRAEGYVPLARALLIGNLRRRRLTCCATPDGDVPPGLAPEHLYAVLGFDPVGDVVHVWNPWGNRFEPSGPPGPEAGYPVRDGHLFVPLVDFVRIFAVMSYETDRTLRDL
jgi:hypothetical protein